MESSEAPPQVQSPSAEVHNPFQQTVEQSHMSTEDLAQIQDAQARVEAAFAPHSETAQPAVQDLGPQLENAEEVPAVPEKNVDLMQPYQHEAPNLLGYHPGDPQLAEIINKHPEYAHYIKGPDVLEAPPPRPKVGIDLLLSKFSTWLKNFFKPKQISEE